MNFEDSDNEDEANQPVTVDMVNLSSQRRTPDSEMISWYGGVAIKGFQKETELNEVVNVLKEAGLPSDYAVEDLEVNERGDFVAISIHGLKPDTCVEIQNNIDGKKKFGKRISVFPLVDSSPTKQDGDKLEELITEANIDDSESKEETSDEYHSSPESKLGKDLRSSFTSPKRDCQTLIKYFSTKTDLDISSESEEESETAAIKVDENFKRKANESPDVKDGFQLVSNKNGKKKSKNSPNLKL